MGPKLTEEQIQHFYTQTTTTPNIQAVDSKPVIKHRVSDLGQMMTHASGKIKILKKDTEANVVDLKPTQESV